MPALDLTSSSVDLTRAICDIHSESGDETRLADAIEAAVSAYDHLEVIRDGDTVVARTSLVKPLATSTNIVAGRACSPAASSSTTSALT